MAEQSVPVARPKRLDSLTGLRFLAAFHVVLFHLTSGFLHRMPSPIAGVLREGPESVTIFFMLSGFVLAYTYRDRAAHHPAPFWWARVARIYPVYLLTLALALPMFLGHPQQYDEIQLDTARVSMGAFFNTHFIAGLACIFLLQAWLPPAVLKWNYPGWSLSAEAFFYLLFPRLSSLIASQSPYKLRRVAIIAWLASISMAAGWWAISWELPPEPILHAWWGDVLQFNPLIRLPEFVIGMAIGFRFMDGPVPGRADRSAAVAALTIIGIWAIHWSEASSHFENSLLLPVYASLVLSLAYEQGRLARFLASPKMVELGHASYSLYLVHAPIIFLAQRLAPPREAGTGYVRAALEVVLTALVAVQVSLWLYRWVEEPARRAVRHWAARRESSAVAAAALNQPPQA